MLWPPGLLPLAISHVDTNRSLKSWFRPVCGRKVHKVQASRLQIADTAFIISMLPSRYLWSAGLTVGVLVASAGLAATDEQKERRPSREDHSWKLIVRMISPPPVAFISMPKNFQSLS